MWFEDRRGARWSRHWGRRILAIAMTSKSRPSSSPPAYRVADGQSEAVVVVGGAADAGIVVLCDHAANAFPPGYGTLGLPEDQLRRHIAYDIGAAGVTRRIAELLGVPAVLSRYSRLLIDLNRGDDDPTLIMRLSDGAIVPGNRHVDAGERERRIARFYAPYHQAVDGVIDTCMAAGVPPAIVSIHSFTESWKGTARPWHVGILWDKDARLAGRLLDAFYARHDLIVGDNEPYTGRLKGDCMWQHGTQRGLAHAIIEIRQDLIRDAAGERAWGDRIADILVALKADPAQWSGLNTVERHGSHTDMPEIGPWKAGPARAGR